MLWGDQGNDTKRTLGIRDKQILYRNAKKRCQNPGCNKEIDFDEMQVGHKTAWSRGGSTTLKNSVCLCYRCNKLQGTDSWLVFMKKQGVESPETKALAEKTQVKKILCEMTVGQIKLIAAKHKVKVYGSVEESWLGSRTIAPTKSQYITKLSGVLSIKDLRPVPKEVKKTPTKKTPIKKVPAKKSTAKVATKKRGTGKKR